MTDTRRRSEVIPSRTGSTLSSLPSNGRVVAAPASGGDAAVMQLLGGRQYEMVFHPRCKTCNSEHRNAIENALLTSNSYKKIAAALPEDSDITWENISNHFNRGHMPLDEAVHRAATEVRAKEISLDVDGYEAALADHITVARIGLQKGFQRMMRGEIQPDMNQTISILNFLLKVDQVAGDTADLDNQLFMDGFHVYIGAIKAVCTPEQFDQIAQMVVAHPVLRMLSNRSQSVQGGYDDSDDYGDYDEDRQLPSSTD